MDPKKSEKIEELQSALYKRDFKSELPPTRQEFTQPNFDVGKEWEHTVPTEDLNVKAKGPKVVAGSFFRKILIFSVIFFILSAALLTYIFLGGWNIISANNVDISFLGPVSIAAGDKFTFNVAVDNENRSAIENATLYIDYPDGTRVYANPTESITNDTIDFGEIATKEKPLKATKDVALYGELNSVQKIKVALEYGIKNSNAKYRKEKDYDVTISSTPLTVTVVNPSQVISNDSVEFKVSVVSNSGSPLTNVLLKLDYPFGFTYASAVPAPSYDTNYWLIPVLNPGEKKDFSIIGQVQGEQNDERVFRFTVGSQSPTDDRALATQFLSQKSSVFVQRPPLAVSLDLNGSSTPVYVTQQGDIIQGTVEITNNLSVQTINNTIQVALSGPLFDNTTVRTNNGFFQSTNNTIVWDKNAFDKLESLDPGEKATVAFSFSTKSLSAAQIKNGTMNIKVTASGERVSQSDVVTKVGSTISKSLRTQTAIGLTSQIVYSTGPFRNKGPIPPKADNKTTYTVTLDAVNTSNDVRGAEVHAKLPSYVHWLGATTPASELVTWNSDTNEVVWRLGDLVAGTGSTKPAREMSFQVEFQPSLSQVDTRPALVNDIQMNAIDSFTNAKLNVSNKDLTTRLLTDPKYSGEEATVKN